MAVARDASDVYGFLSFMRWLLLSLTLAVAALSPWMGLKVTQTGLRPVHALA